MKKAFFLFGICSILLAQAQETKRVLFLGNSYTGVNSLPQLVADIALSLGDTLIFDENTPGGYTLQGHSTNTVSQNKIALGGWDYVVLQEQSQLPAFPYSQFSTTSLPGSILLCQQIRAADSCTKPLFYMTWGRKNGDQANCPNYPPLCTYSGMQGQLRERYLIMGDTNNAEVAPVGAVWRKIRANNSNIELYQSDESHPSLEGSYLAACTFYASIFHKSPVGAAPAPTMFVMDAQAIQNQAALTVFDSLNVWMIDTLKPQFDFVYSTIANCHVAFDALPSQNVDSVYWDFGDGTNGSGFQVNHLYIASGTYTVCAEAWRGCLMSDSCFTVIPCWGSTEENQLHGISIYPNPTTSKLRVQQFGQDALNAAFKIYDAAGKLVLSGKDASEIDVTELPKGVYLLEIEIDKKVSRQQFVKN